MKLIRILKLLLIVFITLAFCGCKEESTNNLPDNTPISEKQDEEKKADDNKEIKEPEPSEEEQIKAIYGEKYNVINGISNFYIDCSESLQDDVDKITWQFDPGEGYYFIYLPGCVDSAHLKISFDSDGPVYVNGKWVKPNQETDAFNKTKNKVKCGDYNYIVYIVSASKSVGSLFIKTESGNMDYILASKENKEVANMVYVDSEGEIKYDSTLKYIKGRGNYSWIDLPKKPFNIKLDDKADLIGSGEAKSYCLIANDQDDTLTRNKSLYDLSGELGLYYTQSKYVDLYINNQYYGLFQLTDKVEVGKTRININDLEKANEKANPDTTIENCALAGTRGSGQVYKFGTYKYVNIPLNPDDITGGYILEFDIDGRYDGEVSGFVSNGGQSITLKAPEYASLNEILYISKYYQEFEDALLSPTGYNNLNKHFSEYIDMESFAINYLLQELARNTDAGITSFFMYKDIGGKLVCAPVWDFDNSLYYNSDAASYNSGSHVDLFVATCQLQDFRNGRHNASILTLFGQLYCQSDFRSEVARVWNSKVKASISDLCQDIYNNVTAISASIVKNAILWNKYNTINTLEITDKAIDKANAYINIINERANYLDNFFKEGYYGIYYFANGGKGITIDTYAYKPGKIVNVIECHFTNESKSFKCWNSKPDGSGTSYYPGSMINLGDNLVLYAIWN